MLSRRELLSGGLLQAGGGGAAQPGRDGLAVEAIIRALAGIQAELRATRTRCAPPVCDEVQRVREQQRTYLRSHQKFPDFMEVGIGVWERVQDWQLETAQPTTIERTARGRYALVLGPTRLVLRPDMREDFLGFPFDDQ